MPKLKPHTQAARREHILDQAEVCFARAGFHRTTMQDICKVAGVSPGALYVYFASKEALIAGIAERNRDKLADQLKHVSEAPDLLTAFDALGRHYFIDEPEHKRRICIEIGAEGMRNPEVGEIYRSVDKFLKSSFVQLFERAKAEGKIAPGTDLALVADMLAVIGDGVFWRRAVDPNFDPARLMPVILNIVKQLLNPVDGAALQAPVAAE